MADLSIEDFELLVCAGSMRGHTRKVCLVAAYLPPNYTCVKANQALDKITDIVVALKRRFTDPYIIIAGDFNHWKIGEALVDFPDIKEVPVGNIRKDKSIDRIFLNMDRSVTEAGTLSPLETEEGQESDHRVAFCKIALRRKERFVWQNYTYRHYNEESVKAFKEWIVMHDWREVFNAEGSVRMTEAYQGTISWAMGNFFPLKTRRKKAQISHG